MLGMKHGKYELIYIYILKEAFEYENFYLNWFLPQELVKY